MLIFINFIKFRQFCGFCEFCKFHGIGKLCEFHEIFSAQKMIETSKFIKNHQKIVKYVWNFCTLMATYVFCIINKEFFLMSKTTVAWLLHGIIKALFMCFMYLYVILVLLCPLWSCLLEMVRNGNKNLYTFIKGNIMYSAVSYLCLNN